jgi:PAS domain S-box-containing protein
MNEILDKNTINDSDDLIIHSDLQQNNVESGQNYGSQEKISFYSKYNILLQTINDGLLLVSNGRVQYSNKIIAELLGYSIDELLNIKIDNLIAPNYKELVLKRYEKRLAGEVVPSQYEIEAISKSGKHVSLLLSVGLVTSEDEKLEFVIIRDLSEIKRKNAELKKRESEFETVFNHTTVAIGLLDLNGQLIRTNEKWQILFEQKDNKNSEHQFTKFLPKKEQEKFSALINQIINSELSQVRTELQLINANEKKFWADLSISAVKNNKNEIQYFILSVLDISKRINIQNQFDTEKKLLQYFMEYVPDTIYFKDIESRFIRANKATIKKMGLKSVDELMGKTDNDLFSKEHAEQAKKDEEEIIKNGTSILNKIEKETWSDGTVTWASTTKVPLKDDDDKIIGTFGLTRDVTEFKKSEDIKNALYKISTAVTTVPDIQNLYSTIHKIVMDLMIADNFYIALYNEKSDTVSFPYFVDEIDPPPEERKAGRGLTEYVLRKGKAELIDAEKDQKLRAAGETSLLGEPTQIWLGVPLIVQGKTIGVVVVQDYSDKTTYGENEKEILTYVSEQIALAINIKHREQKIIEYSEELKESNAAKDKFFSIIAHDLKSPFHGLLGLSRMISEEFDSMNDDELRSSLEILKDSTENTYKLIENLLDWSRLQTGKMKYNPASQNMFMIVEDTRMLLNQNARMKDISIRNKIAHSSMIWGDTHMLRSLVQNIISNSIKFTPQSGSIEISEKILGNMIEYTFSDTGVGIGENDIDKLFRLDVNFSTRGTLDEKGTGLGLVLCKEIVNIHEGEIKVHSKVGVGTKISVTLKKH